jgi:hypothetical protein
MAKDKDIPGKMSADRPRRELDNVVKFPEKANGEPYRLTEISSGGWTSWEHMVSDLAYSIASGDLQPKAMAVVIFDKQVGTLVLRRGVTAVQLFGLLEEYAEDIFAPPLGA